MTPTPLSELLTDIREQLGGESASVWSSGAGHRLALYSSVSGVAPVLDGKRSAFLDWIAQQGAGAISSDGDPATFVATALPEDPEGHILVVAGDRPLTAARDFYRRWLPRYAAQASTLLRLMSSQELALRAERQTTALLEASTLLHSRRTEEQFGERICETAMTMTGAKRVALVRCHGATGDGEVAFATRGHMIEAGAPVLAQSLTGAACAGDYPIVMENAQERGDKVVVYGGSEIPRSLGSLAIIPLRGIEGVIGAIVIEGDQPGQITATDGKTLRLLGLLATSALETVWEIEYISQMARTDPLTGLANRTAFEERLGQLVLETDRFGGSGSLVVIDVDHFKHVNDTYGHQTGDVVLRRLAEILQSATRTVDLCARYGGEELALVLPQTSAAGASQQAERLRKRIAETPFVIEGREIPITISAGVSSYPEGARTRDELFAAADRALYSAKRGGRNRVVIDLV